MKEKQRKKATNSQALFRKFWSTLWAHSAFTAVLLSCRYYPTDEETEVRAILPLFETYPVRRWQMGIWMELFLSLYKNLDFIHISDYLAGCFLVICLYIFLDVRNHKGAKLSRSYDAWLVKLPNYEGENKEYEIVRGSKYL